MSTIKINSGSGKKVKINSPSGTPVTINKVGEISVFIANHLYGGAASLTQSTDTIAGNAGAGELAGFKHNIQLTAFVSPYESSQTVSALQQMYSTGKIKYGLYIPSNRWKDPSDGLVRTIADYAATAWTATGVDRFGVTLGAAKTANYPNHGQEMYTLTSGALGWDSVAGLGASAGEELFGMMTAVDTYYNTNIGRKLSTGAYRFGRTQPAIMLIECLLGGRNSNLNFANLSGSAYTNYGENNGDLLGNPGAANTREGRINHFCSTRTFDESASLAMGTFSAAKTFLTNPVIATIANNGYLMDFTHWHTVTTASQVGEIIEAMAAGIGSDFVYRGDFGSIVEYLF